MWTRSPLRFIALGVTSTALRSLLAAAAPGAVYSCLRDSSARSSGQALILLLPSLLSFLFYYAMIMIAFVAATATIIVIQVLSATTIVISTIGA